MKVWKPSTNKWYLINLSYYLNKNYLCKKRVNKKGTGDKLVKLHDLLFANVENHMGIHFYTSSEGSLHLHVKLKHPEDVDVPL